MALAKPSTGNITRPFGPYTVNGVTKFHYGTDHGWGNGLSVRSMDSGVVVSTAFLPDYGQTVTIVHDEKINGQDTRSRYCHLSTENVEVGVHYPAGTVIGTQGSTGYLTNQRHLHSELWIAGKRVDEQVYYGTSPAGGDSTPIEAEDPLVAIEAAKLIRRKRTTWLG